MSCSGEVQVEAGCRSSQAAPADTLITRVSPSG